MKLTYNELMQIFYDLGAECDDEEHEIFTHSLIGQFNLHNLYKKEIITTRLGVVEWIYQLGYEKCKGNIQKQIDKL